MSPATLRGVLAAILTLAFILRAWGLRTQSFSMDEVYELSLMAVSPADIIAHADGLPPLYDLLLHSWMPLFGGDSGARWLSLILGLVTVWCMWKLGAEVAGHAAGVASAALLAISPIHIYYSQEARSYGLLFLCAVLAIWLFIRARRSDAPRDWVGFWLASVLGLYTHYYFSLLLVGLLVSVAAEGSSRRPIGRLGLTLAALAPATIPWTLLAMGDFEVQRTWPEVLAALTPATLAYTLFTFLGGYNLGPSLRELHNTTAGQAVMQTWPWAVTLGPAAALLGYKALADRRRRGAVVGLLLVIAVPLALCGLLGSLLALGYRVRYVSWAAAPLLAILGIGIVRGRGRWPTLAATAVLVAVSLISVYRREADPRYMTEDARGAARWLADSAGRTDPIFVTSEYMMVPVGYYLGSRPEMQKLPNVRDAATLGTTLDVIRGAAPVGERFWLVYSRPFHGDPKGMLLSSLRQDAQLTLRATLPGIELYQGRGF